MNIKFIFMMLFLFIYVFISPLYYIWSWGYLFSNPSDTSILNILSLSGVCLSFIYIPAITSFFILREK